MITYTNGISINMNLNCIWIRSPKPYLRLNRLLAEIFVISNSVKVTKLCQIFSNKITNIIVDIDTTPTVDILWDTINENVDLMFQSSNELIAIYVSKYVNFPKANTITIFSRSDFD